MGLRIDLGGDGWVFKGYLGGEWIWREPVQPDSRDRRGWMPASVPGSVHDDLWRNGAIPDPYHERNSLLVEWVPARTWIYKRTFAVDPQHRGRRIQLRLEGLDYDARVFLHGAQIGHHRGPFTPATFEVGNLLRYGAGEDNTLAVVLEPAPPNQSQLGSTGLVRTDKSRMSYGWDFCPRMIHLGIWGDILLDVTGPVRIEDVFVRPQLAADHAHADVSISIRLSSTAHAAVDVETEVRFAGATLDRAATRHTLAPGETNLNVCLRVEGPRLWWPNGHSPDPDGDRPLYEAVVRVRDQTDATPRPDTDAPDDAISDERRVAFGLRTVELVANSTTDETALPYTFRVNGKRMYATGWNWVPLDVMHGVPRPAKLERLLTLARRAGVNLLRVWGGGLIETEAFYSLCDRYGIMVWQEFMLSSSGFDNMPSDDPGYVAYMTRQAEGLIPRRRNHPSLVLWCGGNELQDGSRRTLDGSQPVLAALRDAVRRLDPDRHWLPTSPSGRLFGNSLENIAQDPLGLHDVHGPWEHQGLTGQYTLYNEGTSLFHSEFGAEGLTNRRPLDRYIAPEHQWPVSRENPLWTHPSSWWLNADLLREVFGELPDIAMTIRASQFVQAEGVRYAVESNRRRMYQNSGSLPWQLNESYPNASCTSAVDYHGTPKGVYYAVARAYAPLHVTARFAAQAWAGWDHFAAELWAANAHERPVEGATLRARLVGASGALFREVVERVDVGANGARRLAALACPMAELAEDVFLLGLTLAGADGATLSRNRYLFSRTGDLVPLLRLPATTLAVRADKAANSWAVRIVNTGAHAALLVRIEDARGLDAGGYLYVSDNDVVLLPGESITIAAEWDSVLVGERRLEITGWNTVPVAVS